MSMSLSTRSSLAFNVFQVTDERRAAEELTSVSLPYIQIRVLPTKGCWRYHGRARRTE